MTEDRNISIKNVRIGNYKGREVTADIMYDPSKSDGKVELDEVLATFPDLDEKLEKHHQELEKHDEAVKALKAKRPKTVTVKPRKDYCCPTGWDHAPSPGVKDVNISKKRWDEITKDRTGNIDHKLGPTIFQQIMKEVLKEVRAEGFERFRFSIEGIAIYESINDEPITESGFGFRCIM
jgi:hypothetical protein